MSIMLFVILLHLLVARAINARVESPPRLVLLTGRRYGFPSGNSSLVLLHWRHRRLSFFADWFGHCASRAAWFGHSAFRAAFVGLCDC